MRYRFIAFLALCLAACGHPMATTPETTEPIAKLPLTPGQCTGLVAEYCALTGGRCPTYSEAVERRSAFCSQPGTWWVETHQCAGAYRSVTWRDSVLGGGEEYFNEQGRLIAASLDSDYGGQFCNGTSFNQTFGTLPACPGQRVTTAVCLR